MIKVLLFSALLIFLSLIAGWVGTKPGSVQIIWFNYDIKTSVSITLVFILIIIFISLVIYNFILSIIKTKNKIRTNIISRREDRSVNSLNKGIVALISGDGELAEKLSKDTKNIPKSLLPLGIVLSAHSAHLNNNKKLAANYFEKMLVHKELEFLGLRGLMLQEKLESEKIKYARRAYMINPKSEWISNNLFKLESKLGNWREAEKILRNSKYYNKENNKKNINRKISITMFQQAKDYDENQSVAKLKKYTEAFELSPNLVPLSVELASLYYKNNRYRKANKVIEKTWNLSPHPDLYESFKNINKSENPANLLKRTIKLSELLDSSNAEVCLSKAEAYFLYKDFQRARESLKPLLEKKIDKRSYNLMAKIEEEENGPLAAKDWYRPYKELLLPLWICKNCDYKNNAWLPLCKKCNSFDSFDWGYDAYEGIQSIELQEDSIIEENIFDKSI
ncbi:MAG: hypothetical protein CFH01_00569 [Alphaproteobacteria bacterium MarineAlpha2_Bin1]|nr:MAG: hypothetical protein CFH01_00569 [Alphaproteobacteria bacterium MarineAlpha2_Bin1]